MKLTTGVHAIIIQNNLLFELCVREKTTQKCVVITNHITRSK